MDYAHKETDKIIAKIEKEIRKEYQQAYNEISEKVDDYFQRFALKDKKWQEWVADGKKTKTEYKEWRKGQMLVGKRWETMKENLAQDLSNTYKIADSIAKGYRPEVYALNHNYATYEIEKQARADTSYTLYNRQTVERMYRDNPQLYSSKIGKKIQQEINEGKLMRWERRRIQSILTQAVLQGESIPNITKRLESVYGGDHKSAIRNARTMMTGVQNAGRIDAIDRANSMGIPTKKTWLATLDSRTRHWHRQLDGVTIPNEQPFENEMGKIMFPGDPTADGANLYNCRCRITYAVSGYEIDWSNRDLRHDENLEHTSYEAWKADRQSKSNPITLPEEKAKIAKGAWIKKYRED